MDSMASREHSCPGKPGWEVPIFFICAQIAFVLEKVKSITNLLLNMKKWVI